MESLIKNYFPFILDFSVMSCMRYFESCGLVNGYVYTFHEA